MTRRDLLCGALCCFPLFRRRSGVPIAGARFRQVRRGRGGRRYIWLHGDEVTARQVLLDHLKRNDGLAHLTPSRERHLRIEGLLLDPNRMFSRQGAELNLRKLNPLWDAPRLHRVLRRLDQDREKFLRAVLPPAGGLLVALHNNARGYSVQDEVPISDRTALNDPANLHDFLLVTQPEDFERLSKSPYNVVIQNTVPDDDDGSLSRLAARLGVRYVNIEAYAGRAAKQRAMLEWIDSHLP